MLILTLIAGCAADRLHRDGLAAIERGDYETGVADLSQAVRARSHTTWAIGWTSRPGASRRCRASSPSGDRHAGAGQLEAAAALYRRVLAIDPSNDRAHATASKASKR